MTADAYELAREHGLDLEQIPEPVVDDAPEPVRPWARLLLVLAERLAPYGVSHGGVLADARHGALTRALVDLGQRQARVWRNRAELLEWPTLDADAIELEATRATVENLLAVLDELERLRAEAALVHQQRARREALLDGVPGVLSNDPHHKP